MTTLYALLESRLIDGNLIALLQSLTRESGEAFELVTAAPLAAIIAHPSASSPPISRELLLHYAATVERLTEAVSLLPMRHGSTLPSSAEVISMLQLNAVSCIDALKRVYNKAEYSLRLFASPEQQKNAISAGVDGDNSLPEALQGETQNKRYLAEKYRVHLAEEHHRQYIETLKSRLRKDLGEVSLDIEFKKPLPSGFIADMVLLVERNSKERLRSIVKNIQSNYPEYDVILTGPWPPYNFSQIRMQ